MKGINNVSDGDVNMVVAIFDEHGGGNDTDVADGVTIVIMLMMTVSTKVALLITVLMTEVGVTGVISSFRTVKNQIGLVRRQKWFSTFLML